MVNLAPFSFFNAFGANPPVVVFSPTLRRDGSKKDTLLNVEATGEFVVNAAVRRLAEKVNLSSKEVPPDESEVELTGLTPCRRVRVRSRRGWPSRRPTWSAGSGRSSRAATGPIAANLVIGEVVMIHVRDDVLGANGRPDPRKLRTVARLGGDFWCHTSDLFEQKRP